MLSPKPSLREKLKGKIRERSQDKHRRGVSAPTSTEPTSTESSNNLSPGNAPQTSLPTFLSQDCEDTPIRELWNVAYEKLREEDSKLIQEYEIKLQGCLPAALGCVPNLKESRREWMDTILKHKMQEMQGNIWKLTFGSSELQLTGVVQNILGVIKSVNDYITPAVSSSSYASLAWAGVGVLLPDSHFIKISEIWRETQYNDECVAAQQRHQETINSLTVVGAELSSLKKAVEDANAKKDHQNLMEWLCDVDPSPIYNTALNRHEAGTSEWLLTSNQKFTTWMESPRSFLWLHGKAGSGKSILSSSVVKYLKDRYSEDPSVAIAYFYFSFSDLKKQERDGMLRSLIKQICCQRPNMPEAVKKLREYQGQYAQPPTWLLEQSLLAIMCGFSATYIVIDALDECPKLKGERAELMKSLNRILTTTATATAMASNFHIFCTSRKESDIDVELRSHLVKPEAAEISLSSCKGEMEHDIKQYIDSTLSNANYNSWSSAIRAEVKGKLIEKSDGMFQYVRCQFDVLQRLKSTAEIRRALEDLPQGLDETYERMLRNIDPMFQMQVISCLKWLAFSLETLTIYELAEIFILRPENDTIIDEDERIFNPADILTYLYGFIIVEGIRTVRLAHYSIKEYLTSDRICKDLATTFSFTDVSAHLWIARSSLAYVLYVSVTCKVAENYMEFTGDHFYKHRNTLKWYTARYWPDHLEMVPRQSWPAEVVKMAILALSIGSQALIITLIPHRSLMYGYGDSSQENLQHPYYFTAVEGYRHLTELLLSDGSSTSKYLTQEDIDLTLRNAAWGGSKELVLSLLDRGADANARVSTPYWRDGDALQAAVHRGNSDIVEILLESGADINAQCGRSGSALQIAAERAGLEMLELLISHGADINGPSNAAGCVLSSAAECIANTRHIEFLLANGADINMRGTGGTERTALHTAARRGCWDNFNLLLERGADINIGGRYGFPLHGLAAHVKYNAAGALFQMKRLLEMGADPHAQCEELGTALHVACSKYYASMQIAQFLVENGVDVNVVAGIHGTALQACAYGGKIRMAEWLLANGANVNLQGGKYGNALQGACHCGDLDMVRLLLAHDADVNAQGGEFGNALQGACAFYHGSDSTTLVRLLLERGADVNAVGGYFGTALQAACAYHDDALGDVSFDEAARVEIVRILLECGANIHILGGNYGSALHAAAASPAHGLDLLQLLLEHGADVNQVSGEFGTALHSAFSLERAPRLQRFNSIEGAGHVAFKDFCASKIQFLLQNGADVNLMSGKYGSLLQVACATESPYHIYDVVDHIRILDSATGTVKTLLDHTSADINAHGGTFGTALQAAAYSGQTASISLLLGRGARVICHEWCGKYGSALNAAVIKGNWDIVHLLQEAGARPDCYTMRKPNEEWLLQVQQEHGRGAEERYRKFWEVEKPVHEQTLPPRSSLLIANYLSWLLIPFQLLIAFLTANFIRPKKRE
ncbi:hypothetical protein TrVFT333_011151 [Trichoderma virens FT-333]|nr:hypothetical protein TrVFT333_011151 [Trichoderma virens FT-333]